MMLGLRRTVTLMAIRGRVETKTIIPTIVKAPLTVSRIHTIRGFQTMYSPLSINAQRVFGNISAVGRVGGTKATGIELMKRCMSSVVKKRRAKMNKHKLKKRRKLMRMNTKQSRAL